MSLKMNSVVAFLALFALCSDAYIIQTNHRYEFPMKKLQYTCPKNSNGVSPEIPYSPVQVGLNSRNVDEMKRSQQQFTFSPLPARLFKMLGMVVLPSREVCALGEKLENYILPENDQFPTMISIAAWCLPCLSEPIHTKRMRCLKQQLNSTGAENNTQFRRFSESFVAAIYEYYYYRNVLRFFK